MSGAHEVGPRADLPPGTVTGAGRYAVHSGQMVRGPQGFFAKVPGLGTAYRALTRVLPLRRGEVTEHDGRLFVD